MPMCVPSHSFGATHSPLNTSMTVPSGHSHPSTIQTAGQGLLLLSLQVWWHKGCEAHSFLICPLIGHAKNSILYRYQTANVLTCACFSSCKWYALQR